MSLPLRLDKAFTKGILRDIKLTDIPLEVAQPTKGFTWLILSGYVRHITGTATVLVVREQDLPTVESKNKFRMTIPAATANGNYPLFNMNADVNQAQWSPLIVTDKDMFWSSGGAFFQINIRVLEWRVAE